MIDSEIKDFRDALAARMVEEIPEVLAEQVIVSRRGDLYTKIKDAVARATHGLAITVGAARAVNNSEGNLDLIFDVSYEITLWFFPLYHPETGVEMELNEEELRDEICRAVAGRWFPEGDCNERVKVLGFRPGNDVEANVTTIQIQREHDLEG